MLLVLLVPQAKGFYWVNCFLFSASDTSWFWSVCAWQGEELVPSSCPGARSSASAGLGGPAIHGGCPGPLGWAIAPAGSVCVCSEPVFSWQPRHLAMVLVPRMLGGGPSVWRLGWDVLGWKGIGPREHPGEHRLTSYAVFSPRPNVCGSASTPTTVLAGRCCPAGTSVTCECN